MPNDAGALVSATPTFVRVGFSFIDANGGTDSFSLITTVARATDGAINALADAVGAASNASLYEIRKEIVQAAFPATPTSATEAPRESVYDHIVTLFRNNSTRQTQDGIIPAPLDAIFEAETNNVDVENVEYLAVETALENILEAAYGVVSVRFTETRKINKRQLR
jgi:hypothetical protein